MSHSFFVVERSDGSRSETIEKIAINPNCRDSEICRTNILELCDVSAADAEIRDLGDKAAFKINATGELLYLRANPKEAPQTGFQSLYDID